MPQEQLKSVREQLNDIDRFHKTRWMIVWFLFFILSVTLIVVSISLVSNQDRLTKVSNGNKQLVKENQEFGERNRELIRNIADLTTQTNKILCGLRTNTQNRVATNQKYVRDLLAGRRQPIPGVSIADIALLMRRDQETLRTFEGLRCARSNGG